MTSSDAVKVLVMYASQTGNAEHVAKNIEAQAREKGFDTFSASMDEFEKVEFGKQKVIVFVSSTTGDGDPPDNALKFWRYFRKLSKEGDGFLKHLKFTVLGLGDTNYSNFGAHPKKIEKKLVEAGATVFYPKAIADEVETLEATIDPWIAGLWAALEKVVGLKSENVVGTEVSNIQSVDDRPEVEQIAKKLERTQISRPFLKLPLPFEKLQTVQELTNVSKIPVSLCHVDVVPIDGDHSIRSRSWTDFVSQLCKSSTEGPFTKDRPYKATLTSVQSLTTETAVKKALLCQIDLTGMKWEYKAGDSIGLICPNDEDLCIAICDRLGLPPQTPIRVSAPKGQDESAIPAHIPREVSLLDLFKYHLDVTTFPRKAFFRMLAEYCTDLQEKKMLMYLCSKQGMADFRDLMQNFCANLFDILQTFSSSSVPIGRLIDTLTQLAPRHYSACSSHVSDKNNNHNDGERKMSFVFNVVDYEDKGGLRRHGVCTWWLDRLSGPIERLKSLSDLSPMKSMQLELPVFPNPSHSFHHPESAKTSIIMIGPGTGIAPFIGFLEERQTLLTKNESESVGQSWLFYGCRHKDRDYLFRDRLAEFEKSGVLSRLVVAHSRDSDAGDKYVQDSLRRFAKDLSQLMDGDAKIFVCGDAKNMAKDVADTLTKIIADEKNVSVDEARKVFASWMSSGKYLLDIWT